MVSRKNKSFHYLFESIHSLLGFKSHPTSSWADSVCGIMKAFPDPHKEEEEEDEDSVVHDDKYYVDNIGTALSEVQDQLTVLTADIHQLNVQRRQILNKLLDLKGNIRVFCRVRPVITGESFGSLSPVVTSSDTNSVLLNFADKKSKLYNFDNIFHPDSSQEDIFLEVEPVVKSAFDGYNACIFAYGQTGTGKTFTMEGTTDCPGVVSRTMEALFKQAAESHHTFLFSFSMLEIYMGYLKDLLIIPRNRKSVDHTPPPCLSIKTDPKGEIEINNLVAIQVSDFNQAIRLYRLGCHFRSSASTDSNKASSRSHCLIRVSMTCFDDTERRRLTNKLWMVDLGGSERVLKTKACGRRLEEGKSINLALSALGDVINALQRKRPHIPYRNSKLTQVLKDSLGEDSKILMLVHVSPKEEDLCETVCSLNFAARVRSIHLGNDGSTEARVQKEVAMTNLQQKMRQIEDKCDEVRREIRKLHDNLENLTQTPSSSIGPVKASDHPTEVPELNTRIVKINAEATAASSSEIPRFMRPTVSSRVKSGIDHQTSKVSTQNYTRMRRSSSYSTESVTFPKKIVSECSTEISISRSSCLMGLNAKHIADTELERSHNTSNCDLKMAVLLEQGSAKSSMHQMDHLSLSRDNKNNKMTNKFDPSKFLKVEHWLQLHDSATTTSIHAQRNKHLVIPIPKRKNRSKGQRIVEKLQNQEVYDNKYKKKRHNHDNTTREANAEIAGWSISEKMTNMIPIFLNNFTDKDSRWNVNSPFPTSEGIILAQAQSPVNTPLTECHNLSDFRPTFTWCESPKMKKDDCEVHEVPTHGKKYEKQCSEVSTYSNGLISRFTVSDVDNSMMSDTGVSMSQCEKFPAEPIGLVDDKEGKDLKVFVQHSQAGMTYSLYRLHFQTGICYLFKEKLQILCTGILLGMGFQSLGFEPAFFCALTR